MAKAKRIDERVIIISEAASSAVAAAARRLASAGARVLLIDAAEGPLGEAVRAINNAGGRADYAVAAAGNDQALAAAGRVAVARFGRVDDWIGEAADAAALARLTAAAVPLVRREGGRLVVVAPPAMGETIAATRATLARDAPLVRLAAVTAADGADPERVAAAVLSCLGQRGGDPGTSSTRFAARHPALVAAIGVGTVALAAGALARWRRRNRD